MSLERWIYRAGAIAGLACMSTVGCNPAQAQDQAAQQPDIGHTQSCPFDSSNTVGAPGTGCALSITAPNGTLIQWTTSRGLTRQDDLPAPFTVQCHEIGLSNKTLHASDWIEYTLRYSDGRADYRWRVTTSCGKWRQERQCH